MGGAVGRPDLVGDRAVGWDAGLLEDEMGGAGHVTYQGWPCFLATNYLLADFEEDAFHRAIRRRVLNSHRILCAIRFFWHVGDLNPFEFDTLLVHFSRLVTIYRSDWRSYPWNRHDHIRLEHQLRAVTTRTPSLLVLHPFELPRFDPAPINAPILEDHCFSDTDRT